MMDRNINRGYCHQEQTRVKKRAQTQEESRSTNTKLEKGGGSQNGRPIRVTCGKRYYGECLKVTGRFFSCVKEVHKLRYYPIIASREKEGKKVAPNVPKD